MTASTRGEAPAEGAEELTRFTTISATDIIHHLRALASNGEPVTIFSNHGRSFIISRVLGVDQKSFCLYFSQSGNSEANRQLLKSERPAAEAFYALLEDALACDLEPGRARNAAEHVWGYVSKKATTSESARMLADLEMLGADLAPLPRIKRKLLALASSEGEEYLLHSLYFYLN